MLLIERYSVDSNAQHFDVSCQGCSPDLGYLNSQVVAQCREFLRESKYPCMVKDRFSTWVVCLYFIAYALYCNFVYYLDSLIRLRLTGAMFCAPGQGLLHGGHPTMSMESKARVVHVWSVWQLKSLVLWIVYLCFRILSLDD